MRILTFLIATGLVYAQSGDWLLTTTEFGAPQYQRVDFKFDGEKITGRAGTLTYEGMLRDGRVAFESKRADGSTMTRYSGTYAPGEMQGQGTRSDSAVTFTARRFKDKPATPQTHPFTPTVFHNYFSSTIPPVLSIFPGDTVESWSVDAGGMDAQGKRRSPGGNPLTGPFYIEGVMPGDTLVVHFTHIRLSRLRPERSACDAFSA